MLIGKYGEEAVDSTVPEGLHSLYGGEVLVRFDQVQHRYLVQDIKVGLEWFRAPSVTGILGRMLDKSKPLVSWSTRLAKEAFHARVQPGRAYSQIELDGIGAEIEFAHTAALDRAGSIGSQVHEWVESYLNARAGKGLFPKPPTDESVRAACSAARKWIIEVDLQPVAIERILYSRSQQFIGTTDLSAFVVNGRPAIVDWKSSRALHSSYELQLAAYVFAWRETTGRSLEDRWLIHLKSDGTFEARCLPTTELEAHIEAFLLIAAAHHELDKVQFFER